MLFKLISDGRVSHIEMDGQKIGRGVRSVTFTHSKDADMNDCRVIVEFDLTVHKGEDTRDKHVFEPAAPGEFVRKVQQFEAYALGADPVVDIIDCVADRVIQKQREKAGEADEEEGGGKKMTFGQIIEKVKSGHRAQRAGWNGKNQYIEIARRISYVNARGEVVNADHDAIGNNAIAFVGTSGVQIGWLASQADMLAEDWVIID